MQRLSKRQKLFVEQYLRLGNATKAAIKAGYSKNGADVAGIRLLRNARVSAELEKRKAAIEEKLELTTERTLREVARLAYADQRRLFRPDGTLRLPGEWDDDTAAAVASVEMDGNGVRKLRIADKNAALEKAMRYHGLFERDNSQAGEAIARVFRIPPKKR